MGSGSLTKDQTQAPCIGSMESQPLDQQRNPKFYILKLTLIVRWSTVPGDLRQKMSRISVLYPEQFRSVQSLSRVRLFSTPWTAALWIFSPILRLAISFESLNILTIIYLYLNLSIPPKGQILKLRSHSEPSCVGVEKTLGGKEIPGENINGISE